MCMEGVMGGLGEEGNISRLENCRMWKWRVCILRFWSGNVFGSYVVFFRSFRLFGLVAIFL